VLRPEVSARELPESFPRFDGISQDLTNFLLHGNTMARGALAQPFDSLFVQLSDTDASHDCLLLC
jgi:hypothetical protein